MRLIKKKCSNKTIKKIQPCIFYLKHKNSLVLSCGVKGLSITLCRTFIHSVLSSSFWTPKRKILSRVRRVKPYPCSFMPGGTPFLTANPSAWYPKNTSPLGQGSCQRNEMDQQGLVQKVTFHEKIVLIKFIRLKND